MKSVNINTKFAEGEQVYIIKQEKVSIPCSICEGNKKIEYNAHAANNTQI